MHFLEYAAEMIERHYAVGDFDIIDLDFVAGDAALDKDGNSLGKTKCEVINDGLGIARFLLGTGDFEPLVNPLPDQDCLPFSPFDGTIDAYLQAAKIAMLDEKLPLPGGWYFWLRKAEVGRQPPSIPLEVALRFAHKSEQT
jgi:hypothetical protein